MTMRRLATIVLLLGTTASAANAGDWPQWRGPQRDGISKETGLLKEWPKEGPKLSWRRNGVGDGYSTPAVVSDRIYLLGNKGSDEFVAALDAKDGKEVWSKRIGKVGNPNQRPAYPGARSTPTIDADLLYALGSDGDLACLETATGAVKWSKNVRRDFGGKPGVWAYSESPLVDGDVVVCTPGGATATMVALNKKTGDVVWQSADSGGEDAAYASIVIVESSGVKQYVQFLAKGVVGVDAKTGKFLWRYEKTAEGSPANIPTPLAKEGFVYTATGRGGSGLVKLKTSGAGIEAEPVYYKSGLPNAIGGVVETGGYLYGTSNSGLMCVEFATGEVKWKDRSVGAGSVLLADGLLYLHGEKGDVALVQAVPGGYHEKGRFKLPDQPNRGRSAAWAYPVIANGRLYIRDMGVLWCYDVKGD